MLKGIKGFNPDSPLLICNVNDDVVKEVRELIYIDTQQRLF